MSQPDAAPRNAPATPTDEAWPAPFHPGPFNASIRVPGSKSLTNRFIVLAALGDQPSVIREPLVARDTVDQDFAQNRQRFLAEQGYAYRIVDAEDLPTAP